MLDDKWQSAYRDERARRGEVARPCRLDRRAARAWAASAALVEGVGPEGLPPELCIRNPDGVPLAVDPGNPATREGLRRQLAALLSADGATATVSRSTSRRTPRQGRLERRRRTGSALLHELLATVYAAAKEAGRRATCTTPHRASST